MAAALSADMDNTTKVVTYINECKDMGIKILPPDINESRQEFSVIGNSIRFGLEAVKGVGNAAIDAIIDARNHGKFESLTDFCTKVDSRKVNKKVIEGLIKAGALDSMGKRAQLMQGLSSVMEAALKAQRERSTGQRSMFETRETVFHELPDVEEWNESERLHMEKDALGFYITGHPLSRYNEKLKQLSVTSTPEIQDLPDREDILVVGIPVKLKKIQTKRKGDLMAYLTIEDLYGTTEVIIFPDVYRESVNLITQETPLIISGQVDRTDKGLKVIAMKIISVESDIQELEQNVQGKVSRPRKAVHRSRENRQGMKTHSPGAANGALYGKGKGKFPSNLTLTLNVDVDSNDLSHLKDVLLRHIGSRSVPVYLKIINPEHWETLILTGQQVNPTEEMILEVESVIGKGTVKIN
jgi:DNA polymerase-3 subunit alpha